MNTNIPSADYILNHFDKNSVKDKMVLDKQLKQMKVNLSNRSDSKLLLKAVFKLIFTGKVTILFNIK